MWRNLLYLAGCVPIAVLAAAFVFHRWKAKRAGARVPLSEKLLRPAGYTLSRQLTDLSDDYLAWAFGAFFAALISTGTMGFASLDSSGKYIVLLVFALCAAGCTVMAWRKLIHIRRVRLGLLGEQAVAEQLQLLCAKSYQIFHDVPGGGKWNIDHVVVGPAGVFAIETKARTKRPGPNGEPDFKAVFDGRVIRFAGHADRKALEQARANAKWLSSMLSKATGEAVSVQAIVALPGWMVDIKTKDCDVKVLSGKQVPGLIVSGSARVSGKVIQQIAYQLDQRCRDVVL